MWPACLLLLLLLEATSDLTVLAAGGGPPSGGSSRNPGKDSGKISNSGSSTVSSRQPQSVSRQTNPSGPAKVVSNVPIVTTGCKTGLPDKCEHDRFTFEPSFGEKSYKLLVNGMRSFTCGRGLLVCSAEGLGGAALTILARHHNNTNSTAGKTLPESMSPSPLPVITDYQPFAPPVQQCQSEERLPSFLEDACLRMKGQKLYLLADHSAKLPVTWMGPSNETLESSTSVVTFTDDLADSAIVSLPECQDGVPMQANSVVDTSICRDLDDTTAVDESGTMPDLGERGITASHVKMRVAAQGSKYGGEHVFDVTPAPISLSKGDGSRIVATQTIRLFGSASSKQAVLCIGMGAGLGIGAYESMNKGDIIPV